jgi:hypothetical protein
MSLDHHRIPLDAAHKILATFGITSPTKAYERWVKDDGFDLKDFDVVWSRNPYTFIIDWKCELEEELANIAQALKLLGVDLEYELSDDGETGHVSCGGNRAAIAYPPSSGEWERFIDPIQAVIPASIQFRASPHNDGNDTGVFAVLPVEEWRDLEQVSPEFVACFFGAPTSNG